MNSDLLVLFMLSLFMGWLVATVYYYYQARRVHKQLIKELGQEYDAHFRLLNPPKENPHEPTPTTPQSHSQSNP